LSDTVYEADITEAVLAALNVELALAATSKKQTDKQNKLLLGEREKLSGEIKRLSADVSRIKNSKASLFEGYTDGKITKEQYISAKAELSGKLENAEAEIVRLSDEIHRQEQASHNSDKYEKLSLFDGATELTPEIMSLVKGIHVYDATHIEIKFAFSDESDRILAEAE
jgi:cell division septum initiation protein DivIVA